MIPKFRAWRKDIKYMEDRVRVTSKCLESDKNFVEVQDAYAWIEYANEDDFILMQSTGLCDKNGVEIFEKDIIKENIEEGNLFIVNQVRNYFIPQMVVNGKRVNTYIEPMIFGDPSCLKKIEVIGNIYENPELLEVEE